MLKTSTEVMKKLLVESNRLLVREVETHLTFCTRVCYRLLMLLPGYGKAVTGLHQFLDRSMLY
jgi:hypothetical protein